MGTRSQLHTLLVAILGSEKVYFQPPPNTKMEYPCIIYKRDTAETEHADNRPYTHKKRYLITVVDRNPDSEIPARVAEIPSCVYDRYYAADQLNHDVYKLFF